MRPEHKKMISFTVQGEPIAKARPRLGKAGIVYTPKRTRTWEQMVAVYAMQEMRGSPAMLGPLQISIVATFEIPKSWPAWKKKQAYLGRLGHTSKPDWDNLGKAIADACNGIVFRDDSQIVSGTISKKFGEKQMVRIEIQELDLICSIQKKMETK